MKTRRHVIALGGLAVSAPALAGLAPKADEITPPQRIGPFYPEPTAQESHLRLIEATAPPTGRRVELAGQVLDPAGRAIGSAMVLVWQADPEGRYDHSRDPRRAERPAGLLGHGLLRTDREGRFQLSTVRPGAYPDERSASGLRTPHIHFEIIGEEARLITEMYFPDESLNQQDANIAEMVAAGADPARLTAARSNGAGSDIDALDWRIVLAAR